MIPAGITFYNVFQESLFKRQATTFVQEKIAPYQFSGEGRYLEDLTDIRYNDGENPMIEVMFMGTETIPDNVIETWRAQMGENPKLQGTMLNVVQGSKGGMDNELRYVNELYESQKEQLFSKDEKIRLLETEVNSSANYQKHRFPSMP